MKKTLITLLLCLVAFAAKADSNVRSLRLAISTPCETSLKFYSPITETVEVNGTQLLTCTDFEYEDGYVSIDFDVMSERQTTLTVRHPTSTVLYEQAVSGGYAHITLRVKVKGSTPMIYLLFTDSE